MNFPMETKIVGLVKNSKEDGYIYGVDKNYIIPEYQREYSWGENQIESFITSLKRAIDGESVFMGTVQFAYESTNPSALHIIQALNDDEYLVSVSVNKEAFFVGRCNMNYILK